MFSETGVQSHTHTHIDLSSFLPIFHPSFAENTHTHTHLASFFRQSISMALNSSAAFASSVAQPQSTALHVEDVVIVGGGIAGMATALALHRLGIKSRVLEQASSLRVAGTALAVWTNGWRALEALGVADSLRERFVQLSGSEFDTPHGKCLSSWDFFSTNHKDVELRGVDRSVLLETLENALPSDTICYGSRVRKLHNVDGGYTRIELTNGSSMQTKVLVGCDGIGSVVAKELGLGEAQYAGYSAIRGLAVYPEGHNFKNTLKQTVGQGVRMGGFPLDSKRLYWFLAFTHPTGRRTTDPKAVKEEALQLLQGWPEMAIDVVNRSPLETLNESTISDRWLWPWMESKLYRNGMTVVGDAMHPMTPNLAQGGCSALEDGVVLGRVLSTVLKGNSRQGLSTISEEMKRIELALDIYTKERRHRMFSMVVHSNIMGRILNVDGKLFCSVRDALLPHVLTSHSFIRHTLYDCGHLV